MPEMEVSELQFRDTLPKDMQGSFTQIISNREARENTSKQVCVFLLFIAIVLLLIVVFKIVLPEVQ